MTQTTQASTKALTHRAVACAHSVDGKRFCVVLYCKAHPTKRDQFVMIPHGEERHYQRLVREVTCEACLKRWLQPLGTVRTFVDGVEE